MTVTAARDAITVCETTATDNELTATTWDYH
jgi:hypothetical protein